ncbi:MAG: acido-empty-quinoprotein group A, partial [Acidobacteria bacterium]|nr:acido-empty-quinoprotein group A [Acidobacteriota bacterium]
MRRILLPLLAAALITAAPAAAGAQEGGLDPASLTAPLEASWPTYSGDYTGRRYSKLTQVNTETVKHLTLAWTVELNTGMPPLTGPGAPDFIGGVGSGFTIGSQRIKGSILQVGDLLYVTAPDHVWAL